MELGKKSSYISTYTPSLLYKIPRQPKREELGIHKDCPIYGVDIWNAYELSWLDMHGKPCVAIAELRIDSESENIVESKSLKLYLNSFNDTKFASVEEVQATIIQDISKAINGRVELKFFSMHEPIEIGNFSGINLDQLTVSCDKYTTDPSYLKIVSDTEVSEMLYSNLLKSNCLITNQPDWASIEITYMGPQIDHIGLLQYLVSFRNHNEFHEQCVERIFIDIMTRCAPSKLSVYARYTRRGGIDINPYRSNEPIIRLKDIKNLRLIRQ